MELDVIATALVVLVAAGVTDVIGDAQNGTMSSS
jgi:hypothetical protein